MHHMMVLGIVELASAAECCLDNFMVNMLQD